MDPNGEEERVYKYQNGKIKTPEELGFLEYYMLPNGDEFEYVYRPGDDSFFMLSVLKEQLPSFPPNCIFCEVGSGSGILSTHISKWLQEANNPPVIHVATDISSDACLLSRKYYEQYGARVEQVCTSLTNSLRLHPDVIICNPPYVPTDPQEKESEVKYFRNKLKYLRENKDWTQRAPDRNLIAYSYMGGPEGLDTTRKLIASITWPCRLYLIIMGQEGLQTIEREVMDRKIVAGCVSAQTQALQRYKKANEQLFVLLVCYNQL